MVCSIRRGRDGGFIPAVGIVVWCGHLGTRVGGTLRGVGITTRTIPYLLYLTRMSADGVTMRAGRRGIDVDGMVFAIRYLR